MPNFYYVAVDSDGKEYKGLIEAESRELAAQKLQKQKLMVTIIKKEIPFIKFLKGGAIGGNKVTQQDVLLFSRQLSTLVKARISLEQCLDVMVNQTQNPEFQTIIKAIRSDVVSGTPLSAAMSKYPKIFNNLFIGMVKAGEASGKLPEILVRTAKYLDRASRLKSKITSAMVYPALVISVGFLIVFFLMWKVIPMFEQMYSKMGSQLPVITKAMIFLSREVFGKYILAFPFIFIWIAAIIAAVYIFQQSMKQDKFRIAFDSGLLRLPIVGIYLQKVIFARFSQTLGILVSNGVPILESMDLVSRTVSSRPIEIAIIEARERIKEGEKIAETLKKNAFFPPLVVQMVSVGEQTGKLGEVLEQISDFYEEEVEISTATLISVIEPIMIMGLAVIVGIIVMALYLPIFKMYNKMQSGK